MEASDLVLGMVGVEMRGTALLGVGLIGRWVEVVRGAPLEVLLSVKAILRLQLLLRWSLHDS